LSLAIGKRGQNVRLATKLVGWNIDIRSEEEIKREVTEQMGALIASGASVPLSVIEGLTAQQTDTLAEHGINDIDALSQTSIDDLVEFLDLSLDEAEVILKAAKDVVSLRDTTLQGGDEAAVETEETAGEEVAATEEAEEEQPTVAAAETTDTTAEGYDEAVEAGVPFGAEPEILAQESADPVALTEAEPFTEDEIVLQEAGRDLRPDTIVPAPDITSAEAAAIESLDGFEEFAAADNATEESDTGAPAVMPDQNEAAASSESPDREKPDASPDAAN
jgi:N utilization substance protein A